MEKLIIGIDLCDTYTQAAVLGREETWLFPTVICREKQSEEWHIGEDAYKLALVGEGVIVDKLLSLAVREGTSTISQVKYTGGKLLAKYLSLVLEIVCAEYADAEIAQLVFALENMEMRLMDSLMECMEALKIPRDRVHIASHTECYVYYVLSQKRDVWGGQVGMFALSDKDLRYYEMKVIRGPRQMTAWAEHQELEESFNLNVLDTGSGARMADKILCACADRLLQKKIFSSVFLTGKGFLKTDWAQDFMKQICNRRRVFVEPALFARGAAYKAEDYLREQTSYPFVCICEGKLKSTISMKVEKRDAEVHMVLAQAGESWYEARSILDVIVNGQDFIDFTITPQQNPKQKRVVSIPLDGFPVREDKTTRVRLAVGFLDEKTMVVKVVDQGFGEIYPAGGAQIRQEVMI